MKMQNIRKKLPVSGNAVKSNLRAIKSVVTANSPTLLVATTVVGIVATGILSAKAGWKAHEIVATFEDNESREATLPEKVSLTWLTFAAPAITGASAVTAVVGLHTIHNKRHATMAGLYAITSNKLEDYQAKAEELLGVKKTQQLNNSHAQVQMDSREDASREVIITHNGGELCYDDFSGRYFQGSMAKIEQATNDLNRVLLDKGDSSLNDFYDYVGLPAIEIGNDFGWSGKSVNVRFGAVTTPEGKPALSFWFHSPPKPDMGRSRGV